jgi:hypothetical protein
MYYRNWKKLNELGVIGAIAVGTVDPAAAWYGYHHRYYNYYGGGTWNGCPPR